MLGMYYLRSQMEMRPEIIAHGAPATRTGDTCYLELSWTLKKSPELVISYFSCDVGFARMADCLQTVQRLSRDWAYNNLQDLTKHSLRLNSVTLLAADRQAICQVYKAGYDSLVWTFDSFTLGLEKI
ncbi:hypothetical protein MKQ70_32355 [Chitinophaga sedimenti]|uniref:hypothetical protein n=1 Tax=Chitinophaga sedimenti TaxID=2033606 RepID=UPI0020069A9A|nr:hypothetical protein [Chitinophaga sedimenti]MCK7559410.1 hypothetical protein [Chitinophaga sedimenti]